MDHILIKPILSEKSSMLAENSQHVFQVAKAANKLTIKKAVEERFDVQVKKVATSQPTSEAQLHTELLNFSVQKLQMISPNL